MYCINSICKDGVSGDPCSLDSQCNTGLYCSKTDPATGNSVSPHCCLKSPLEWWDPSLNFGAGGCTSAQTCTTTAGSSPFNTGGLRSIPLPYEEACCVFDASNNVWQDIGTY